MTPKSTSNKRKTWTAACTRLLRPWDFLSKSTGVGCHFLLQGIFLTQRSNPGLLHCRQTLYHLSHRGSPYIYICTYMYIYVGIHKKLKAFVLQKGCHQESGNGTHKKEKIIAKHVSGKRLVLRIYKNLTMQ